MERREYNRELVEFLGPKLGSFYLKNLRLHRTLQQARILRLCMNQGRALA